VNREPQFVELRSAQELQRRIEARLKEHAFALSDLANRVAEMQYRDQLRTYKEVLREEHRSAQGYSSMVIGVGYAGYFTLWGLTKSDPISRLQAWSALLIGISLALYVAWEVYVMASNALHASVIEQQLKSESARSDFDAINAARADHCAKHRTYWPMALAFTTVPALLGAAAMLWGLVARVAATL
jgi:hypothetical protein